ncbi:cell division protein FtsL [Leuconostoc rapi]|uniref:cell division protein FtsL n=1 Tax=Leuconostoc rapi TaxID=1406906 RepID=UPI00195D6DA2|nr:cell division protein FtsL [Leuconostoc rapi]MBM7434805.1 cell division protein FtsL [Leuconostoc rapi]
MAQNAYQYSTIAESIPLAQPKTRIRYKTARWTRKERMMVAFVSAVVMVLMVGVVFSSMQTSAARANTANMQSKTDDTKEANNVLRSDIQRKTSKKNLDEVAKKYHMTLSDSSVRNVNQ